MSASHDAGSAPRGLLAGLTTAAMVVSAMVLRAAPAAASSAPWTIDPSGNVSTAYNYLDSISCVGLTDCWAAGWTTDDNGGGTTGLIEHGSGNSWSVVTTPVASGGMLNGVTCLNTSDCWAVGVANGGNNTSIPLIEHFDGLAWAIISAPHPAGAVANILHGVTCVSASDCWTVGTYDDSQEYVTLTEHFNGSGWAVVSSPNVSPPPSGQLFGVSCASSADCWAVGFWQQGYQHHYGTQTLVEHNVGTGWTIISSPNTSADQVNALYGLTCVSSHSCWAVGTAWNNPTLQSTGSPQTLVEEYTAAGWSIVPSPNYGSGGPSDFNDLKSVSCSAATDCWAVGEGPGPPNTSYKTLIEHNAGSGWTIVAAPNASSTMQNSLFGVSCAASDGSCSAAGYYDDGNNMQTLIVAQPKPSPAPHFAPQNVGAPQVAVTPDGSTQLVFWKDTTTNLLTEAWYTGRWNGPINFAQFGALTSTPSVAVTKDGSSRLVFWRGAANRLIEVWWNGHWNGPVDWTAANGWPATVSSAPSVALAPDGTQIIFWQGTAGHLDEVWWNGHWNGPVDWTAANGWGSPMTSAPSVALAPDGTQIIFWQGAGGHLVEVWWKGKWNGPVDWTAANGWGSPLTSAPSVTFAPDGTQLIFWQGAGGHLDEVWWKGHWNGPVDWTAANGWGSPLTSAPSVTIAPDGTQLIFWQGAGSHLDEVWWKGHWNGPVDWSA